LTRHADGMVIAALWCANPVGGHVDEGPMLEQLAISRRIVTDGHEVVPAWRIETPDGAWLILTRFDPAKPGQSDRGCTWCGASWPGGSRKPSS
jgi:hypothetical protein